jgi:hypothetical protein
MLVNTGNYGHNVDFRAPDINTHRVVEVDVKSASMHTDQLEKCTIFGSRVDQEFLGEFGRVSFQLVFELD